ncbi:MAG: SdrD B-like domain-containing protein, partial [Acidobacteriota bacterium]
VIGRVLQLPGELGDLVFRDDDLDGRQDGAEPGVEGVTVSLLGESGEVLGQTSTAADGGYRFYLIESASVGLAFDAPDGLSFTAADVGDDLLDSDVDPATGEVAPFGALLGRIDGTRDAGLGAGLGDRIWLDVDANGVQDSGEAGIPGVTVTLFDAAHAPVDQTTSDADGRYVFFGPAAGAYYLEVTAPAGFEFTARDVGNDDADSDVNGAGRSSTFLFIEGSIENGFDAGLVPAAVASIGDRVWQDTNLNGVQDGGERGFRDVVVVLFDAAGLSQGTVTTAGDGSYAFNGLAAGSYYLSFSEPAGFCFTARDVGNDDGADSDVDPETLTTALFSLAEGASDGTRDAGLVPDASIGNRVWLDDGDGIQTGGEIGVGDVTVRLYDASDALLDSTTTDLGGHYAFSPGPGEYYLEFLLPDDTAFAPRDQGGGSPEADQLDSDVIAATGTTTVFTLGPGQVDASRDAGIEPAVVGNRVWLDQNVDGLQQPGEAGLAGVEVRLLDAGGAEVATTTTASGGIYQFFGVPSGGYRIEVRPPPGAAFSAPDVGEDDLVDSDVDPATGRSELFQYVAGSANRRWDAGLQVPPIFQDGFESGDLSAWSTSAGSKDSP